MCICSAKITIDKSCGEANNAHQTEEKKELFNLVEAELKVANAIGTTAAEHFHTTGKTYYDAMFPDVTRDKTQNINGVKKAFENIAKATDEDGTLLDYKITCESLLCYVCTGTEETTLTSFLGGQDDKCGVSLSA